MGCQGCFLLFWFLLALTQGPMVAFISFQNFDSCFQPLLIHSSITPRVSKVMIFTSYNKEQCTDKNTPVLASGRCKNGGMRERKTGKMRSIFSVFRGTEVIPLTETKKRSKLLKKQQQKRTKWGCAKSKTEAQLCLWIHIKIMFTSTVSQQHIMWSDCFEMH